MKITKRWLQAHGACEEHVSAFAAEWPKGVTVTAKVLARAQSLGLDLHWFGRAAFGAKYVRQEQLLRREYIRKVRLLWNEFERGQYPHAEYVRRVGPLLGEYELQHNALLLRLVQECESEGARLHTEMLPSLRRWEVHADAGMQ